MQSIRGVRIKTKDEIELIWHSNTVHRDYLYATPEAKPRGILTIKEQ